MNKPSFQPRPGGGFNQGLGHFDENMDENAMQAAMQNKALSQQAGGQTTPGGANPLAGMPGPGGVGGAAGPKPRPVGSLTEELLVRPAKDIVKGLASIFDLNALLGMPSQEDDPQTAAKKKQMLQRYNQLNEQQQAEAKKRYDLNLQKKKQQQEQDQAKKQQLEQQKAQSVDVPSGPKKGPVGPAGSKKQKAVQKLQTDRKTLSGPQSVN